MNINELNNLLSIIKNPTIGKALLTTYHKLNNSYYNKVLCSVSGGSDSDIVLDIVTKCDNNKIVEYYYFNTGLEYQATKEHIEYLQEKYNIVINTVRPKTPITLAVKKHGQPFLSKMVSENIQRLQKHNFKWEDKPLLNDLEKIYYSLDCITIDKIHCYYCIYCRNVKMCKTIKSVIDSIKKFY